MKNRKFNIVSLVLVFGITLALGGCSKNGEQSEGTKTEAVGTPDISIADTFSPQTSDGGNTDTSANTTEPNKETAPTEGATIPEEWHRVLI